MEDKKNQNNQKNQPNKNGYDDHNTPEIDLPQDVKPDQVPRKDGPGGEGWHGE